jgi:hypothetical protein
MHRHCWFHFVIAVFCAGGYGVRAHPDQLRYKQLIGQGLTSLVAKIRIKKYARSRTGSALFTLKCESLGTHTLGTYECKRRTFNTEVTYQLCRTVEAL